MDNMIVLLIAFWGLWLLIGIALVHLETRVEWDLNFAPSRTIQTAIRAIAFFRRFLIVPAIAVPMLRNSAAHGGLISRYDGLLLALGGIIIPVIVLEWYLAGQKADLERNYAGDPDPEHRTIARKMSRRQQVTPILSLAAYLIGLSVLFGPDEIPRLFYGYLLFAMYLNTVFHFPDPPSSKTVPIEFPDLPLKHEIIHVLEKTNRSTGNLLAAPGGRGRDTFAYPLFYYNGWSYWGRKKFSVVVPMLTVRSLNHDAYVAALSLKLAQYERRERTTQLAVIPLIIVSAMGINFQPQIIIPVLLAVIVADFVAKELLQGRSIWTNAYNIWRDADPEADRTVHQFIKALAAAMASLECIRIPHVVIHRLEQDYGLMAFLNRCDPETKATALADAFNALNTVESAQEHQ